VNLFHVSVMSQLSRYPNRALVGIPFPVVLLFFWAFRLGRDSTRDGGLPYPLTDFMSPRCAFISLFLPQKIQVGMTADGSRRERKGP